MTTRRSFFKSLAMLGAAAAGCPGIFIPKFEPVRWKKMLPVPYDYEAVQEMPFLRDFAGKWRWYGPPGALIANDTVYAVKPTEKFIIPIFIGRNECNPA